MTASMVVLGVAASLCLGTTVGCASTPRDEGEAAAVAVDTASTVGPVASSVSVPPLALDQDCIGDLAAGDVFVVDLDESGGRTEVKPYADMPRDAIVAIVPQVEGAFLGAVLVRTVAGGDGMTVDTVYDADCTSVSTYRNLSNESAAKCVLRQYEAVEYTLGGRVVSIELAYGEGEPILLIRGYLLR